MTTCFIYLPGNETWINLTHVISVECVEDGRLDVIVPIDQDGGDRYWLVGTDVDLFLAALKPHTFPIK